MRRLALAAMALAVLPLAALGVGCARHRPKPPDAIVFWEPWPPAVLAPAIARFEAENPALRVSVRQVPLASVSDSLAAALAAGAPPDLCALASDDMRRWLDSGSLCDWSAGVADQRDSLRGWPPCTLGDALYGLPWLLAPRVLWVQPALFARAGLDASRPPGTWAQLRAAAARIQKLGGGIHGFGIARGDSLETALGFLPFAWGNGGEVLSADLDSSRLASREVLEALEFYASLRHSALLAGSDTLAREFAAGRLGMRVAAAGDAPASAALALVPRPGDDRGEHASYADEVVLVSLTASHRKEAALRLARALARPRALREVADAIGPGLRPATAAVDSAPLPAAAPATEVLARQCATSRFAPAVARWDSMRVAIGAAVDEVLAGHGSASEALEAADARVQALAGRR